MLNLTLSYRSNSVEMLTSLSVKTIINRQKTNKKGGRNVTESSKSVEFY